MVGESPRTILCQEQYRLFRGAPTLQIEPVATRKRLSRGGPTGSAMSERGVIERFGDGAIPGTFVGFSLGASRAYLQSRTIAEKSAEAIAAAKRAKVPPTAAALRALQPKPLPVLLATTATYAALGGVYTGVEAMAENMRGKDDLWNRVIGGAAAGSLVGVRSGSVYTSGGAAFACAFTAFFIGALGGTMGPISTPAIVAQREAMYKS